MTKTMSFNTFRNHLKKNFTLGKFPCNFLKFSFDGNLFFNLYFDILMIFFKSIFFIYLFEKCSVINLKVHFESTIFLEFIHIFI
jgi:hypothetical protein